MKANLSHMIDAWRACRTARCYTEAESIFRRIVDAVKLHGPLLVGHSVWTYVEDACDPGGAPMPCGALQTSIKRALEEYGSPGEEEGQVEVATDRVPPEAELAKLWGIRPASSVTIEVV